MYINFETGKRFFISMNARTGIVSVNVPKLEKYKFILFTHSNQSANVMCSNLCKWYTYVPHEMLFTLVLNRNTDAHVHLSNIPSTVVTFMDYVSNP
jgi:hypothetical protein